MTIPKATKYRIRRHAPVLNAAEPSASPRTETPSQAANGAAPDAGIPFANAHDDGFGNQDFRQPEAKPPTAAASEALAPGEKSLEEAIEEIRAEGLTGRQLRMARRMAQKHGIEATSDFEAVVLLRRQGIDPFERGNILSMVRGSKDENTSRALARIDGPGADARVQLPQTVQPGQLPSTQLMGEDQRAREIIEIQRDIARRRRRKLALLAARLAFFVFLPTLLAGWYFFTMATPLYATKTEFVIQKADGAGGAGLGGLFSGTQLATSQDSITVQSYLQSREAMLRLNKDEGFKAHFQQEAIDPIRRLEPDATNEAAFDLYRRMVKIGYDPSEGIIRMEVIAADPDLSRRFSESLISYAEEQVDQLTARLRDDQMEGANTSYADAEAKVFAAQAKVLELQEQVGILDPVSETNVVMGQISGFETQLQQKKLELGQLLDNPRPNEARVAGVRGDIQRLERLIADLRSQLTTKSGPAGESLAAVTGQLRIAEAELQTRQMLLSAAAQQLESARIEANKQVRYLEMGVRPVAPDEPTYPRAFENTLLAFLIFSGIYLMLSLTASILREQVSS
ncbi:MAG: capsule biosynthesis protein [Paracoccaceae bacterium]